MKRNKARIPAIIMLLSLLFQTLWPTTAWALTSGPAQPEASSFEPVGTSDMVDNFSGDFSYNIPLMDVEGYPLNISYHSGITMDQEATWVGLGWNVNAGAITRNMRGLPDDFSGDIVRKELNMKPNETYGVSLGFGGELFGIDALNLNYSLGVAYNNYTGFSTHQTIGLSFSPQEGFPGTIGLGLTSGEEGLTVSPHITFSAKLSKADNAAQASVTVGTSFNSRTGLKQVSLDAGLSQQQGQASKGTQKKDGTEKYKGARKDNRHSSSASLNGTGTSVSFGAATYVPQISMPMKNSSFSFSAKLGGTVIGIDVTGNIGGNYSKQALAVHEDEVPAYGYLNSHDGQSKDKVMLDFNREKDGAFTENTPDLPLTNFSYDLYSVSGQGVGGCFRPYRSDLGYVFDSRTNTTSDNGSLSGEVSFGDLVQGGIDIGYTTNDGSSGKWTSDNSAAGLLKFRGTTSDPFYEPAYFKETGEKNVDADPLYDNIWGDLAARVELQNTGSYDVTASGNLANQYSSIKAIPSANYRTSRVKRNQYMSYLKKSEYSVSGLNKDSLDYWVFPNSLSHFGTSNIQGGSIVSSIPFLSKFDPSSSSYNQKTNDHHIAEVTTTKTDGTRYVYGLPLYNIYQKETSFNVNNAVNAGHANYSTGYVTYNSGDNSKNTLSGTDNFYTGTELPPFIHSYLLTDVLSTDYVDVTGNGPTDDDLGNYTKFIYSKKPVFYQWRTPFSTSANQATYDGGLHTVADDERGSYVYGVKEVRFLERIETKNYIAVFDLDDRKDGYGTSDENGSSGLGSVPLKYIKTITLYSKPDYKLNGNQAFAIKQVHFVYNYDLCRNVPNNNHSTSLNSEELSNNFGKLTLKKVYFTYGNSFKAQLSPYEFSYNELVNSSTVNYDIKGYDRWGYYKPNTAGTSVEQLNQQPFNHEFSYVDQNASLTNQYVSLWNLSEIKLPSGGKIDVSYESDDYAYVQDRPALQMFKVTSNTDGSSMTYGTGTTFHQTTLPTYLFFQLPTVLPNTTSNATLASMFLNGVSKLYFRFYMKVNASGSDSYYQGNTLGYEYVSGYADIAAIGGYESGASPGNYDKGYIQVNAVQVDNGTGAWVAPMAKAALQFARIHTPRQAYNNIGTPGNPGNQASFIQSLANASFINNLIQTFEGANGYLLGKGFGEDYDPGRSWIRLGSPAKKKLGGGLRVTQIAISDEWDSMITPISGQPSRTFNYGQIYDYTTVDPVTQQVISSGVASYEPGYGADENPMREPIYFGSKPEALLAPENDNYMEAPLGESFFPSPSVGYSKVTVKNLPRYINPSVPSAGLLVNSNATGKVVYEFYTAKDFPVILHQTGLDAHRKRTNPLGQLLHLDFKDNMTASEGYSVILNDMHGKPKSQMVYAENQAAAISGTKYNYKHSGNQLTNTCTTIDKSGVIANKRVGVDYDFIADFREQQAVTNSMAIQGNLHAIELGLPFVVPSIIPSISNESNRFRSAVVTKVINKYGIIESSEVFDMSSHVATKNLAWDAETGDILLTQTTTEFNDNTYAFTYPAHWAAEGMGAAYKNTGLQMPISILNSSGYINSTDKSKFMPGDEIEVLNSSGYSVDKLWVYDNAGSYVLIDKNGNNISPSSYPNSTLKIIRSGRRNMQASPAGKLASFNNPIGTGSIFPALSETYGLLSATSVVYSNKWSIFCECGITSNQKGNPYILGLLGNWRQKTAYTYLTLRNQDKTNENSNIRKDGTFQTFTPFWSPNAGADWVQNSTNWQYTNTVTNYSPHGFELENVDPLLRYSSALYGYNYALPVGVASNAQYRQIAFDGFEDYDFTTCVDDHFGFKALLPNVKQGGSTYPDNTYQKYSHTGRRSAKVGSGQSLILTKPLSQCQ